MNNLSPDPIKTKQHFEVLDGLRGVAALGVVIFHFMEWVYADYSKNFIAHGFLAVDFFFCLSGFVIGYAYDDRIGKMGIVEFLKSRLIRLHPLVIFGSILGLAGFLFDPFGGHPELISVGKMMMLFFCSILLIPYPVMDERAFNLFSFNAPAWSLFWEYVANIFYAFILYKISRRYLFWLTIVSAVIICVVCYKSGNLLGGWSRGTFWDGAARVSYSFLAGLLIYRSNWIIKNKIGFVGLAVLLFSAFIMPFSSWNWLSETLVVLLFFPLIISLGAGTNVFPKIKNLCILFGNLSYPLYMTHYAAIWIFGNYYVLHKPSSAQLSVIVVTGVVLLIGFAYLVMILFDIPVRKYLNNRRKSLNKA